MQVQKKILIAGGSSDMGRYLAEKLSQLPDLLVHIGDYKIRRGARLAMALDIDDAVYINVENEKSLQQAIPEYDCVIVTFTQRTPLVQKVCFEHKVPCIDLNPYFYFANLIDNLELAKTSPSITMAGFMPGFSGLMVKALDNYFDTVSSVDVYYLQNTRSHLGKRAISDAINIMSEKPSQKKKAMNHVKEVNILNREYEMRQVELGEKTLIKKDLGISKVNYWTGWKSKYYTKTIAFLIQHNVVSNIIPLLQQYALRQNLNNKHVYIQASGRGIKNIEKTEQTITISASSIYDSSFTMVKQLIRKVTSLNAPTNPRYQGLSFPYEWLKLKDIKEYIVDTE